METLKKILLLTVVSTSAICCLGMRFDVFDFHICFSVIFHRIVLRRRRAKSIRSEGSQTSAEESQVPTAEP